MELSDEARATAEHLLEFDDSQLLEQLAMRQRRIDVEPEVARSFDPPVHYDETEMGTKDELRELGMRILHRWNGEAHRLVCSNASSDPKTRGMLADALSIGPVEGAAFLSGLLMAHLAIPAALASVVAAIIIKRFFQPAVDEVCAAWAKAL